MASASAAGRPDPLALLSDSFAPELADGELAHLRGLARVSSHGISYFGIEFISSPTTAQAQQTAAMNLALSVVQNKPRLDVRVKDEVKPAATPAKEAQVQGPGWCRSFNWRGVATARSTRPVLNDHPDHDGTPGPGGQLRAPGRSWHRHLPGLGELCRLATTLFRRPGPAGAEPAVPTSAAVCCSSTRSGRRLADPESDPIWFLVNSR